MKTQMKRMKVSPTVMAMTNRGSFQAGHGGGQLRAQHDEDHAIQDQLHRIPHGLALGARGGQRAADQVGVMHGHARRGGGQDARAVDLLGTEVGGERDQDADEDLQARLFANLAHQPFIRQAHAPRDGQADDDAAARFLQETQRGGADGKAARHHGAHGKREADQARGVVEQGFAFEDVHQARRDGIAGGDRRDGHGVRRRQDGAEREGDGQRHAGDQPVDEKAHAQHGKQHQADGQHQDRARVGKEGALGDAPAIEKQQRGNEEQKENVGVERYLHAKQGQSRAAGDLDQGQRQLDPARAGEKAAQDDGQHENEDDGNGMHEGAAAC
jgi:hypothetical protein